MSIPTNAEIFALLNCLKTQNADELETQWLEFKPWTDARVVAHTSAEYAVSFANADGGLIVFGVGRVTCPHPDSSNVSKKIKPPAYWIQLLYLIEKLLVTEKRTLAEC